MLESADTCVLTPRQLSVLECLDRRLSDKEIESELGITRSRIADVVRDLKNNAGVNTRSGLVAWYRYEVMPICSNGGCTFSAPTKMRLSPTAGKGQPSVRVAEHDLMLADAQTFRVDAPWTSTSSDSAVPRVLDGEHAVLWRLAIVVGIVLALLSMAVLAATATDSLSRAVRPELSSD